MALVPPSGDDRIEAVTAGIDVTADHPALPGGNEARTVAHEGVDTPLFTRPSRLERRTLSDPNATVTWGDQTWQEMFIGDYDTVQPVR